MHRLEKSKGKLAEIKGNFFEKTREYIEQLRSEINAESERSPSSPKLIMMKDELVRAERDFKRIYDLRQRKILLLANAHSTGAAVSDQHMLPREKRMFNNILELLKEGRGQVCNGQEGGQEHPTTSHPRPQPEQPLSPPAPKKEPGKAKLENKSDADKEPEMPEEPEEEGNGEPEETQTQDPEEEEAALEGGIESYEDKESKSPYPFTIVQMRADMDFSGPEREYRLKKEDIVSLPENIAAVLLKKKKAVVVL